jgi:hypothetical protein
VNKVDNKMPNIVNFSIEPVTEFSALSSIISKARVRIFYTGLNRNLTYITEEFAEKLLSTLPYTPVGGLWDGDNEDFTDHGGAGESEREKFRAFGVVPENPNLAWETHLDKDGVLRRYACCDVYLWTARYQAAREIPKKTQSMELYLKSVQGNWKRDGSLEYFEFTDGQFFGLTALGEGVEPCFEGAAFYSLQDADAKEFFTELKKYTLSTENQLIGGTEKMDNQNTPATVEPNAEPVVEPVVEPVTDPVDEPATEPVEPTAEPTTEPVTTDEPIDEPADPAQEPTEEPVDEPAQEPTEEPAQEPAEPVVENTVSKAEYDALAERAAQLEQENANYKAQIEEYVAYKNSIENAEKEALVEKFSSLLSEEQKENLQNEMSNYSLAEFKREISVIVLEAQEEVLFSKNDTSDAVKIEQNNTYTGAARLMQKYNKD